MGQGAGGNTSGSQGSTAIKLDINPCRSLPRRISKLFAAINGSSPAGKGLQHYPCFPAVAGEEGSSLLAPALPCVSERSGIKARISSAALIQCPWIFFPLKALTSCACCRPSRGQQELGRWLGRRARQERGCFPAVLGPAGIMTKNGHW